jgi:hypothetical protein
MGTVRAVTTQSIDAPPAEVLEFLRDYTKRAEILTGNYTAYRVEAGGHGDGTVIAYHFAAGGRERDYRLRVEETDRALRERDELSSYLSTWTVEPAGAGSKVTLEASWEGAGGVGGFFERTFAPRGLGRIQGEVLGRLAAALRAA